MAEYNYSPELKDPFYIGDVDFLAPEVRKQNAELFSFFRAENERITPLPGLVLYRKSYPSYDGASIPYFVLEPEGIDHALPAMIYYHGGGFIFPVQPAMLMIAQQYAKNCGIRVLMPDYRVAPDNSCQTILEDCYSMLQYVYHNAELLKIDREQLLVYGDSAGGALAAGVTHMVKDRKGPSVKGLILVYPVTDDHSEKYPSVRDYAHAAWTAYSNRKMWEAYFFQGDCGMRKYAVPMAFDDLCGMPPSYVEPQEMDVLRDEGLAYADKLRQAGNKVEVNLIPQSYHGFDADLESPLVQRVLKKRYQVIESMLKAH